MFPISLVAVILAGLALIVYARADRRGSTDTTPPVPGVDHWHAAYGIFVCDKFLTAIQNTNDPLGIHTHGDGVIHIHPASSGSSGRNAKLGKFFDAAGIKMTDSELKLPEKLGTYKEGSNKCNGKAATLKVQVYEQQTAEKPKTYESGFKDIRFIGDRELITIAFVADGTTIPKPASEPTLDNLSDVDGATTTTTPATGSTVAGATTTVAGATTTAAGATTTAASSSASTSTSAAATSTTSG